MHATRLPVQGPHRSCCPALVPASRRSTCVAVRAAKKGGGGKKPAQKKGGSALAGLLKKKEEAEGGGGAGQAATHTAGQGADVPARPEQYQDPDVLVQLMMITAAYKKQYGKFLIEAAFDQLAEAMYKAPFVCLAHNMFEEGVDDPLFTYANRAALQLFEASWDELIGMPSRLSADEAGQEARNAALQKAAEQGAVKEGNVWRVSRKGTRFKLREVELFNVTELDGTPWGQAAVIREYELEDGTVVTPQGEQPPPSAIELPPSLEDVQAAEARVREQGDAVRGLKEGQGLANQDPAVQAAVAELQARKAALAELQGKYEVALREAAEEEAAPATLESSAEE